MPPVARQAPTEPPQSVGIERVSSRAVGLLGGATILLLAGTGLLVTQNGRFAIERPLATVPALPFAIFAMLLGLAWLALSRALTEASERCLAGIVLVGLILRLMMLATEPALEIDYARYVWDGAMVANGHNPYRLSPQGIGDLLISDPRSRLASEMGRLFGHISYPEYKTIYPPVAQSAFAVAYTIKPFSLTAWRVVCIAGECATLILLLKLLQAVGRSQIMVALYWWNPLVIKELVNSAHMEAVLVPLVLGGVLLLMRQRTMAALVVLCLAAGTKLWPLVLLPLFVRPLLGEPLRLLLHVGVAAALLSLMAVPVVLGGIDQSAGFVAYAQHWSTNSLLFPGLRWLVHLAVPGASAGAEHAGMIVRVLISAVLAVAAALVARRPLGDARDVALRACMLVSLVVLLSPAQFPWYIVWVLPLAVLNDGRGWHLAAALAPAYYAAFHLHATGGYESCRYLLPAFVWIPVWVVLAHDFVRLRRHRLSAA